jgi:xanthine dehydrogenase large subunit
VAWLPGRIAVKGNEIAFEKLVHDAYMARIQLSATGFYKTPEIHWDRAAGRGKPFYYFAYGAACSEVTIDVLTGEYRVPGRHRPRRRPVAEPGHRPGPDRGRLHPGHGLADDGGAGLGRRGRLRTYAPSTYKIPTCADRPEIFNIRLLENANAKRTPSTAPRPWASRP